MNHEYTPVSIPVFMNTKMRIRIFTDRPGQGEIGHEHLSNASQLPSTGCSIIPRYSAHPPILRRRRHRPPACSLSPSASAAAAAASPAATFARVVAVPSPRPLPSVTVPSPHLTRRVVVVRVHRSRDGGTGRHARQAPKRRDVRMASRATRHRRRCVALRRAAAAAAATAAQPRASASPFRAHFNTTPKNRRFAAGGSVHRPLARGQSIRRITQWSGD